MKKSVLFLLFTVSLLTCSLVSGQDKLGITRHNHISIHVKDVPVSAAFYRDVVGLKPIPVPENLKATRAWFDLGNGQ